MKEKRAKGGNNYVIAIVQMKGEITQKYNA